MLKNETIETINVNLIIYTSTMISSVNYNPKFLKLKKWIPIDRVNWYRLSSNPNAIHILEKNLDKVDWSELSLNPNAIHMLEKNVDKVNWYWLSKNPNIFEYDYKKIKNTLYNDNGFVEELMMNRFHPSNMDKWYGWGFDDIDGIEQ